jgi:hypothetical protein
MCQTIVLFGALRNERNAKRIHTKGLLKQAQELRRN